MLRVRRFGKAVPADEVFLAWTSGDVERMLAVIDVQTNVVDRHHLLTELSRALFEKRDQDPAYMAAFLQVATTHIREAPQLIAGLKAERVANHEATLKYAEERGRAESVRNVSPEVWGHWGVFCTDELLLRLFIERRQFVAADELLDTLGPMGVTNEAGLQRMRADLASARAAGP
jgi:hypothetical protein